MQATQVPLQTGPQALGPQSNLHAMSPSKTKSLTSLPGEIIDKIVKAVMESSEPVDLCLFTEFIDRPRVTREEMERADSFSTRHNAAVQGRYFQLFPRNKKFSKCYVPVRGEQLEDKHHYQDWIIAKCTCHAFKKWGEAHFFKEKTFLVTAHMLRDLRASKVRLPEQIKRGLTLIKSLWIRVTILENPCDITAIPKCHHFPDLDSLTVEFPRSKDHDPFASRLFPHGCSLTSN